MLKLYRLNSLIKLSTTSKVVENEIHIRLFICYVHVQRLLQFFFRPCGKILSLSYYIFRSIRNLYSQLNMVTFMVPYLHQLSEVVQKMFHSWKIDTGTAFNNGDILDGYSQKFQHQIILANLLQIRCRFNANFSCDYLSEQLTIILDTLPTSVLIKPSRYDTT